MVDNTNFTLKNMDDYISRKKQYAFQNNRGYQKVKFNTNAILALFDKNNDSVISKREFDSISEADFEKYKNGLNEYKRDIGEEECNFSYGDLNCYLDDHYITEDELEGKIKSYKIKDMFFKEDMQMKDASQMNIRDIKAELKSYGVPQNELDIMSHNDAKNLLSDLREQRVLHDENSDVVDFKIGTYAQGDNNLCTFLATISTFTPEQLKDMCKKKTDEVGNVYYEVTFPNDKISGISVTVSEKELNDGEVTFEEKGVTRTVSNLPEGDKDVTLLTMAFMKRFGYEVYRYGAFQDKIKDMFRAPGETLYRDATDLTEESIRNLPKNSAVSLLCDVDLEKNDLSTSTIELPGGITGTFTGRTLELSNGTTIRRYHSFAFKGIDPVTNEIILTGNEFTNTSELRLPISMAPYFETAMPINQ